MQIKEAQREVDEWIKTIGVRYFNELTNLAILNEEVGELSSLMARMYGEQSFKRKEDELSAKANLEDEMADVLWVLMCLANQTGIDLETALKKNIEKKTKRDKDRHQNNPNLK
jgi:NTP pyrophosphatase (non-canonical NTP hydrolase)